jgi:mRNA interferase HigB
VGLAISHELLAIGVRTLSADWVQPDYVVFNVRGNNYRVITRANFTYKTFWIKHVFTHQEYERWKP